MKKILITLIVIASIVSLTIYARKHSQATYEDEKIAIEAITTIGRIMEDVASSTSDKYFRCSR